jgi:hypothetical protein
MFPGFERIIEERIMRSQKSGDFDNLPGAGKPLELEDDRHIPEDLRLAHKILKNADCVPPEIEIKREIRQMEDLLTDMKDTTQKYKAVKKLNFLVMKLNTLRNGSVAFDLPQRYTASLMQKMGSKSRPNTR